MNRHLRPPHFPLCAAALCALALGACRAERRLIVETRPPGAQVRLDDELVGHTPLDLAFEHYGDRRLTLYRHGYHTHSEILELGQPWYSQFPLDLITEVLLPFGWKDLHQVRIPLEPESGNVSRPDLDSVLLRAESLRRAGPTGPTPSLPQGPPVAPPELPDRAPGEGGS